MNVNAVSSETIKRDKLQKTQVNKKGALSAVCGREYSHRDTGKSVAVSTRHHLAQWLARHRTRYQDLDFIS